MLSWIIIIFYDKKNALIFCFGVIVFAKKFNQVCFSDQKKKFSVLFKIIEKKVNELYNIKQKITTVLVILMYLILKIIVIGTGITFHYYTYYNNLSCIITF